MVIPLVIDGSHGEGGGQILRTSLSLAAITGRALSIRRIRANRRQPGLAAQHLTAVRAMAALCRARISGDELGSQSLDFAPDAPVRAGDYTFDVAEARQGGSAGSVTLVLQTILLPLAFAPGESHVVLRGGTHLPWSPSFDYVRDVWLPALSSLGIRASIELDAWGWYPAGRGQVRVVVKGSGGAAGALLPLNLIERGRLRRVTGRAVAANLPAHIPQRMAQRAEILLRPLDVYIGIRPECVRAASSGAGIFLTAEYDNIHGGFSALGMIGKPSEQVAEEATGLLWLHHASNAALEQHLGDQILLPLCFARAPSTFSVEQLTRHLRTNAWVIEQFRLAQVTLEPTPSGPGKVTLTPLIAGEQRGAVRLAGDKTEQEAHDA